MNTVLRFLMGTALAVIVLEAGAAPRGLVIYAAREIVTLDPARPSAQAVSVKGDRNVGVGSLDELKQAAGSAALLSEPSASCRRASR